MKSDQLTSRSLIRRAAFRLLSRRDYSEQTFKQKLKLKGFSPNEIDQITTEMIKAGYLQEHRFVENFIHWQQKKGYGPLRIKLDLEARGIAKEIIAEHLQITDNAWLAAAQAAWQKHFKGQQPTNLKEKAKQMRFLQYRGFTHEHIEQVLEP